VNIGEPITIPPGKVGEVKGSPADEKAIEPGEWYIVKVLTDDGASATTKVKAQQPK